MDTPYLKTLYTLEGIKEAQSNDQFSVLDESNSAVGFSVNSLSQASVSKGGSGAGANGGGANGSVVGFGASLGDGSALMKRTLVPLDGGSPVMRRTTSFVDSGGSRNQSFIDAGGIGTMKRSGAPAAEIPDLKSHKTGRMIVIDPSHSLPSTETYNNDPITKTSSHVVTGKMRIVLSPLLWACRRLNALAREIVFGSTAGKFIGNTVRTARYTAFDFLPKQIIVQFSKFANLYFLFISLLQLVPGWSPTGQFTTIFPLSIFVTFAIVKEGIEDYYRHKQDAAENCTVTKKLQFNANSADSTPALEDVMWKDVMVGDVVLVEQGEAFPADIILLSSSTPNGICYIETSNLDGESHLKQRQALIVTQNILEYITDFGQFTCQIRAETPTGNLDSFDGNIDLGKIEKGKHALTINQMLPRGTTLTNTDHIFGVVAYTGEETKIRQNASRPKNKSPSLEKITNKIVIVMFLVVVFLASLSTALNTVWEATVMRSSSNFWRFWYLSGLKQDVVGTFFSCVILYNTMIPISLYVAMEFVKIMHVFFINNDLQMYDPLSDTPAQARTSTLHEDLGQVQYVFTDKTGTLTQNTMVFKKMSVAGVSYSHGSSGSMEQSGGAATAATKQARMNFGSSEMALDASGHQQQQSKNLIEELLKNTSSVITNPDLDHSLQVAISFLLAVVLCHTVVPNRQVITRQSSGYGSGRSRPATVYRQNTLNSSYQIPVDDMAIHYQSSSPDEIALVDAAREMTFILRGRTLTTVTLNALLSNKETTYTVLHTIEFSSKRKRMSTIYRYPDGRIVILCKGADSVILERLKDPLTMGPRERDDLERTLDHLDQFAMEGLRTLLYASRVLDAEEYRIWSERFDAASMSLTDRIGLMEAVAEEIECEFDLLGATAIEDKLQFGVPETIDKLRRSGIKVWMLTGDKRETAINIAYSCQLAKEWSEVRLIDGKDIRALENSIGSITDYMKLVRDRDNSSKQQPVASTTVGRDVEFGNTHGTDSKDDDSMKKTDPSLNVTRPRQESHVILVIDGDAIAKLESQHTNMVKNLSQMDLSKGQDSLLTRFLNIGILSDGVICCRFSPSQKALVVSKVREAISGSSSSFGNGEDRFTDFISGQSKEKKKVGWTQAWATAIKRHLVIGKQPSGVTLAIGDGANDISMIQCAHVGVGITGREGLAASRASDYAVAQFRFLQPLMFIHGRWSYVRICLYTLGTFYKCITFYLCQMLFQIFTGWSGTSLFEQWTLTLYNILFSSLPVIIVGIFEKDLNKSTLLSVPELYQYGQFNRGLNFCTFLKWIAEGMWHAVVAVFVPFIMYNGFWNSKNLNVTTNHPSDRVDPANGFFSEIFTSDMSAHQQETSIYALGTLTYTIVVLLVNIKVSYVGSHNWTIFTHLGFMASVLIWWAFTFVYSVIYPSLGTSIGYDTKGMASCISSSILRFLFAQILAVILAFGLFDAVTRPSIWFSQRVAAPIVTKKRHIKVDSLGSVNVNAPHGTISRLSPMSSKSSSKKDQNQNESTLTDVGFTKAGARASEFAAAIVAANRVEKDSARDSRNVDSGMLPRDNPDEIDWGGLTPIWQVWESRNRVFGDQVAGKESVVIHSKASANGRPRSASGSVSSKQEVTSGMSICVRAPTRNTVPMSRVGTVRRMPSSAGGTISRKATSKVDEPLSETNLES